MSKLRHLVTGWNRGGLGYVYKLLLNSGIDVGTTFGADTDEKNFKDRIKKSSNIEVSPYVVPFLDRDVLGDVQVTFLVRDPLRVLNSLYFLGSFHNERSSTVQRYAFRYLPRLAEHFRGKPSQAGVAYIYSWLDRANQLDGLKLVRVEDDPADLVRYFAGPDAVAAFCSPDVNASRCKQLLLPSMLPEESQQVMLWLLSELGYRESFWSPRGGHAHYINPDWHC
jgi:hypothetical protein